MRILFLSNFYPPADLGGWEQWCHEVAEAFGERGHDVWVLTSNYGLERVDQPERNVFRTLYLESDLEHYRPLDVFFQLGRRDRHNRRVMRSLVERIQPDVIFVWGMWQLDPGLAVLAEGLRPGRVAYYFCGYWPIDPDPHTAFWAASEPKAWVGAIKKPLARVVQWRLRKRNRDRPKFQHAACVSRAVRDLLCAGGAEVETAEVIYGGIELEAFQRSVPPRTGAAAAQPLKILYAGSVNAAKGVDTLLKAIAFLAKDFEPHAFHASIVGGGHPEFRSWAEAFIQEEQIQGYVELLPRVDREAMPELLKAYDVLAFPSAWPEPLARMMMEGLA
ncbi:MAG: glycosyltransferase family 4 protein, partial [Chloroflexota bacterium]